MAATTNEMLSSDDPCAMATMLILASASAANTRAAMPRWPAIPIPTTATVASPERESMPSISPRAIWSRNSSVSRSRARRAAPSGTEKQIDCSDDDCEMSETLIPWRCSASKVRAAIPGTPSMPFPATVSSACPPTAESALTG